MFKVKEILNATRGRLLNSPKTEGSYRVSIDTRTIQPGEVFIALKGKNFDGHDFIQEAFKKGAAGCVISEALHASRFPAQRDPAMRDTLHGFIIEVPDTTHALADLAAYHRRRFDIPVIAITGSNGKTTTKDLTALALSAKFKVLKTTGTLNNLIGVSLTLLQLVPEHECCVLELGTSSPGEIGTLVEIARPNTGIITNIGPSHLEFFKDLQTVYREKASLFADFKKGDRAIWNGDDPMLADLFHMSGPKKITFGKRHECDYRADKIKIEKLSVEFLLNEKFKIRVNALGGHNVYNCLTAIAAAAEVGIEIPDITDALAGFESPRMRMQILKMKDILIIKDCYNSNPRSMESAICALCEFEGRRKILVSGDMLELGRAKEYFHHEVGKRAAESPIDLFIGVGELSKGSVQAALRHGMSSGRAWHCDCAEDAGRLLKKIAKTDDVILIKGSRAVQMEKTIECFTPSSTH